MIEIHGNTYPVREKLKVLGGIWNGKCWLVPEAVAEEARALVPPASQRCGSIRVSRTCKDCGCRINYGVYCGKCEYR